MPESGGSRCPSQEAAGLWRMGGLVTFPARRHDVQTSIRRGVPATRARTLWMLGLKRRLVRRCEWLRCIPTDGCLPHMLHTAATARPHFVACLLDPRALLHRGNPFDGARG